MATATYVKGEKRTIQYLAAADIVVDQIVVCGATAPVSVGVACQAIADTETGIVDIAGVYDMPKVSAGVIKAGEAVDWDATLSAIDDNQSTLASGDVGNCGVAMEDAGNGDTTVKVQLLPGVGVLT